MLRCLSYITLHGIFNACRVLARSYLMMLYVIFPINLNFPIRSRCVFKAIIHRKKQRIILWLLEKVFSFSKTLLMICSYFSCFFIYHFCHIIFYTLSSFSIFVRDFPFSSFPLNIWNNLVFLIKQKVV